MSQYLQRLNIASVEEVGVDTNMPHYTQHVDVVEVVDSDGNPWEPVPGPDPWDELVIADKASNNDGNKALVGDTIAFTTATYTGGNPETTIYRHRIQTKDNPEDAWTNGSWTNYDNTAITIVYNVTSPGQIRFQCQARDPSEDPVPQVNSFGSVVTSYAQLALVSNPTITGTLYEGTYLTCTKAVYSGGLPPVVVESQIQISDNGTNGWTGVDAWGTEENGQHLIGPSEVGKYFRVSGRATDSSPDSTATAITTQSFSDVVGPALSTPEFGDISVTVNDIEYDHTTAPALTILMNDPLPVVVSITGDANPTYSWEARNDYPLMVGQQAASTVLTFPQEGGVTVTCTLTDRNTEEKNTSVVVNFFVVDAFD